MSQVGHNPLPVRVYTPESPLRHPRQLAREMMSDMVVARELAWRLFVRDLSAQHRQSLLGYLWVLLPPLAGTLVWVFLNKQGLINIAATATPYPVFVLTGTLLWESFVVSLNSPLNIVRDSSSLLAKINFPREALLLAGLGQVLFTLAVRLVLLVSVFLWYQVSVPSTVWLAPLGLMLLVGLGFMFGLLLVPLGMLYQDVGRALGMVIGLWFFVTPVVYPAPTSYPASLLIRLNPVSSLLLVTRDAMTTGQLTHLGDFWLVGGLTCVGLLVGWILYRLAMPHMIARMGG